MSRLNTLHVTNPDEEVLSLLSLVHAVGRSEDVLVGDEGSPAHVPGIIIVIIIMSFIHMQSEPILTQMNFPRSFWGGFFH